MIRKVTIELVSFAFYKIHIIFFSVSSFESEAITIKKIDM